jgi:hypothetical protein
MKSLRNMMFIFLVGLSSLGLANDQQVPKYIARIPLKYSELRTSLIQLLEMPELSASYQEGVRSFLNKWSRSIVKLNHLSAQTFGEGLTPNLLNLVLFTQEELKNRAIEFIPEADAKINSGLQSYRRVLQDSEPPAQPTYATLPGLNSWKIENTLAKWLKERFIYVAAHASLSPQEYYLIWSFMESLFPYKKSSPHYVSKDPNDITPDYSFIFDYIEDYIKSFQSGEVIEDFENYAGLSEINDPKRPLNSDEMEFLKRFFGLEKYVKGYITKIPKKYALLKEKLISALEMPTIPASYQEGVRSFLEGWSKDTIQLNKLSVRLFGKGLSSNLLNIIFLRQVELKEEAVYFSRQALLSAQAQQRNPKLTDYDFTPGYNSRKIQEVLRYKLRHDIIYVYGNQVSLTPEEHYLLWFFVFNFPSTNIDFIRDTESREKRSRAIDIFSRIKEYVEAFQSATVTESFQDSIDNIYGDKPLSSEEKIFIQNFYEIEQSIKVKK